MNSEKRGEEGSLLDIHGQKAFLLDVPRQLSNKKGHVNLIYVVLNGQWKKVAQLFLQSSRTIHKNQALVRRLYQTAHLLNAALIRNESCRHKVSNNCTQVSTFPVFFVCSDNGDHGCPQILVPNKHLGETPSIVYETEIANEKWANRVAVVKWKRLTHLIFPEVDEASKDGEERPHDLEHRDYEHGVKHREPLVQPRHLHAQKTWFIQLTSAPKLWLRKERFERVLVIGLLCWAGFE